MANDSGGSGWFAIVVLCWFLYLGIVGAWHSKARYYVAYGLSYGMNYDQVNKQEIPHDCDWLKAPLGDKECHYDAKIQTITTSADRTTGKPIYSDDDGKTWNANDHGAKASVNITWERVED